MLTSAMIVYHGSFSCFISGIKLSYILKLSFSVHQKIFMHQLKNKTKQEPQTGLNRSPEDQNQQHTFVYVSAWDFINFKTKLIQNCTYFPYILL